MTPNFTLDEFKCNCGCPENLTKLPLLETLQILRNELNEGIEITSGYRCAQYNKKVGGSSGSSHVVGLAADILVPHSTYAYRIIGAIYKTNVFNRIGFGKLNNSIVLHVDIATAKVPEVFWGY